MKREEVSKRMDDEDWKFLLELVMGGVKKPLVVSMVKAKVDALDKAIEANPAMYKCNGMRHIDWMYNQPEEGGSAKECYDLSGLLYEYNHWTSIQCQMHG